MLFFFPCKWTVEINIYHINIYQKHLSMKKMEMMQVWIFHLANKRHSICNACRRNVTSKYSPYNMTDVSVTLKNKCIQNAYFHMSDKILLASEFTGTPRWFW